VVVIPTLTSEKDFGRFANGLFESQVIQAYTESMIERFDEDRVRYRVFREGDLIEPNSLLLVCSIGWEKNTVSMEPNYSKASFGQSTSRKVCELLNEALTDWGKCYADYRHRTKEFSSAKDIILRRKDTLAVKIEPFLLNGPSSDEYAKNLGILGEMLAQAVVEFLAIREELPRLPTMYK
jgi:hypothetical protein